MKNVKTESNRVIRANAMQLFWPEMSGTLFSVNQCPDQRLRCTGKLAISAVIC